MTFGAVRAASDRRAGRTEMDFELRLYRMLCLGTAALLLGVIVPTDLLQRLPLWLDVMLALFGVLSVALYRLAARGMLFTRSYLLLIALVINVSWFANGASMGSVGYFFFAVVVYAGIFFRGVERWTYLVLYAVNGLLLLVADFVHPEWIVPFHTPLDRLTDLAIGFVTSTIGLTMMILLVRAGYDEERRRQDELNGWLTEVLELNAKRTAELEALLAEVRTLRGLLPICSNCKSVRDDAGLWTQIERYVGEHTDASFTHSLCPACLRALYPEYADAVLDEMKPPPASNG